jgi:transposase, IS30 family
MLMISERPPEVEDRAVPGHREGDLLMGNRQSAAAIATLVERQTRYCQLVASPRGQTPRRSPKRSRRASRRCPPSCVARSPGTRVPRWPSTGAFSVDTGVEVYFCDPRSPWQRGSNENTNGLLRQYFPKRESLAGVSQERCDEVAAKLNGRPRKTLGFHTPAERLAELIDGLDEPGAER